MKLPNCLLRLCPRRDRACVALVLVCVSALWWFTWAGAGELEDRRTRIAVDVFPRVVAVDLDLREKLTSDQRARLYVIYERDPAVAQHIASLLNNAVPNIGGVAVEVIVVRADATAQHGLIFPAAAFLAEPLDDELFSGIVRNAAMQHMLLFSPFAGDVERGAMAGIFIGSRIKPYFNIHALADAQVRLNEKLLSISERYE